MFSIGPIIGIATFELTRVLVETYDEITLVCSIKHRNMTIVTKTRAKHNNPIIYNITGLDPGEKCEMTWDQEYISFYSTYATIIPGLELRLDDIYYVNVHFNTSIIRSVELKSKIKVIKHNGINYNKDESNSEIIIHYIDFKTRSIRNVLEEFDFDHVSNIIIPVNYDILNDDREIYIDTLWGAIHMNYMMVNSVKYIFDFGDLDQVCDEMSENCIIFLSGSPDISLVDELYPIRLDKYYYILEKTQSAIIIIPGKYSYYARINNMIQISISNRNRDVFNCLIEKIYYLTSRNNLIYLNRSKESSCLLIENGNISQIYIPM